MNDISAALNVAGWVADNWVAMLLSIAFVSACGFAFWAWRRFTAWPPK